jgi:undecaprenyl-diphosphatase
VKLFVELTESLKTDVLAQFDVEVTNYVMSFKSSHLTNYFIAVTNIGDVYGYLVIFGACSLLFYLIFKSWSHVLQLSLVLFLALSSNLALKEMVDRQRPTLEHLVTVETLSYPSGHAMTAMAFYGFLIYMFSTFRIGLFFKILIAIALSLFILSIGISRIYLGVHFPSDVAGGFIAGFFWVIFCVLTFNLIKLFRRDPESKKH